MQYTIQYRGLEVMSSASLMAGGPVRERSWVWKFSKKQSEQIWVGSLYDSLHGPTFPPIRSPPRPSVHTGRLAKLIARHSYFRFRSSAVWDLESRWQRYGAKVVRVVHDTVPGP